MRDTSQREGNTGCWIIDNGYWIVSGGRRVRSLSVSRTGYWILDIGPRIRWGKLLDT